MRIQEEELKTLATRAVDAHNRVISATTVVTPSGWIGNVNTVVECTLPEKILMAAHSLEEAGQSPFSAEALIVAAWQKYPRAFGLKGYVEQYPDSNKVLAAIMGGKGIARRGWLAKMGQKLYALTRDGRQVIRRLFSDDEQPEAAASTEPVKVSPEHDKLVNNLLASSAFDKYREGRQTELTFADACRFWNVTDSLSNEVLNARLDHVGAGIAAVERQVGFGSATLSNGRSISPTDLEQLGDLHEYLEERFSRHLTLLRNRSGKPVK